MTTQTNLDKLRSKLPRGYGKKLAELTNKSESAVYQALTGDINSPIIIEAAIDLAQQHSKKSDDIASAIKEL